MPELASIMSTTSFTVKGLWKAKQATFTSLDKRRDGGDIGNGGDGGDIGDGGANESHLPIVDGFVWEQHIDGQLLQVGEVVGDEGEGAGPAELVWHSSQVNSCA